MYHFEKLSKCVKQNNELPKFAKYLAESFSLRKIIQRAFHPDENVF